MIFNGKGLHYITVKIFSSLLKGNTSKHHSDFYCLNCFHSFRTENKLESHKKLCENKYFCIIVKPSEDARNSGNLSTTKIGELIPSDFSMSTISSFKNRK